MFSKEILKIPHTSLIILGSNITITEEIVQKAKVFVQVIIYNGKLNKHYVSTGACLNENLKTKSSVPLTPDRS